MILIFGGAYQGKLDYALKNYNVSEKDVYRCHVDRTDIDFDKRVIDGMDKFVLACVKEGVDARKLLEDNLSRLRDKIIIFGDISRGVVPAGRTERAWRETAGICMTYLGRQADEVISVFCGIGNRVK